MEVQLFHYNVKYMDFNNASGYDDGLAAVSFFYESSPFDNTALNPALEAIYTLEEEVRNMGIEFEVPLTGVETLSALLPQAGLQLWDNYYYYSGSQTLPHGGTALMPDATDCTEPVTWIVYERTIPISEAQMTYFRRFLAGANTAYVATCTSDCSNCVHNFRPVHQFFASATPSTCEGLDGLVCTLAEILGGSTSEFTGREFQAIAGRKSQNKKHVRMYFLLYQKSLFQVNCPLQEPCSSDSSALSYHLKWEDLLP